MECLAAFSTACNVLQVVEFGAKVITTAAQLYRDSQGGECEIRQFTDISDRLHDLCQELQRFQAPRGIPVAIVQQLEAANKEVLKLSDDFHNYMQKFQPRGKNLSSKIKSLRKALHLLWRKEDIDAMMSKLSEARSNLVLAFLLYMHSTQTKIPANDVFESKVLKTLQASSEDLSYQISELSEQVAAIKIQNETQRWSLTRDFQLVHEEKFTGILHNLQNVVLAQFDTRLSLDTRRSIRSTQQRVLDSWYFQEIDWRRNQISEAYQDTFAWVLNSASHQDVAWDNFTKWLKDIDGSQPIYWIAGKPGSGKSTLMRFLEKNVLASSEPLWLDRKTCWIGSCFLWSAGSKFEKSIEGVLRSLLHQICCDHRWLIELLVNDIVWEQANLGRVEYRWSVNELHAMLQTSLKRITTEQQALLFVDGLDELAGSDTDREKAIDVLAGLSRLAGVRLCVASRPWNIFEDSFGVFPRLSLQDLTADSIAQFVKGSLSDCTPFQNDLVHQTADFQELIDAIIEKAAGVFLWVRLVVEELRRECRDGASLRRLRRTISNIPGDLDAYFKRILTSIDLNYQYEGSATLQILLFATENPEIKWPTRLLDFEYLEEEDLAFALQATATFRSATSSNDVSRKFMLDAMRRRINSRCMGLVEILFNQECTFGAKESFLFGPRVTFFHRSLLDFMRTKTAQTLLHAFTNEPFPSHVFLCNVLLANCVTLGELLRHGLNHVERINYGIALAANLDRALCSAAWKHDAFSVDNWGSILDIIKPLLDQVFDVFDKFGAEPSCLAYFDLESTKMFSILKDQDRFRNSMNDVALVYGCRMPNITTSSAIKRKLVRTSTEEFQDMENRLERANRATPRQI